MTLRRYSNALEGMLAEEVSQGEKTFYGKEGGLTALPDEELELSYLFGHCLVKRLSRRRLFSQLRKHKGYLQTAGLICSADKRRELTELLARCGVVRITRPEHMSASFCGEVHDGEYPLRRYTRIVNIE